MDEKDDLGGVDVGNHFIDHTADDALLEPPTRSRGGPSLAKVASDRGAFSKRGGVALATRYAACGGGLRADLNQHSPTQRRSCHRRRHPHRWDGLSCGGWKLAGPAPRDIAVVPFRRQIQPMFKEPQEGKEGSSHVTERCRQRRNWRCGFMSLCARQILPELATAFFSSPR